MWSRVAEFEQTIRSIRGVAYDSKGKEIEVPDGYVMAYGVNGCLPVQVPTYEAKLVYRPPHPGNLDEKFNEARKIIEDTL
jgi:hypothetical protein